MLEKYEKNFDENEFMRSFMERKQISTKKQALAELRKLIKKEGYYQTKIKEALKKRYPDAFVAKISQGAYSQAGIPDVMFIKDGHYFGFEVKRPVVGIRSKLQEQTARMIQAAGGTAAFVCWPEEAIREVEKYEKAKDKYMINRTKYKDIKRYDHKQMEDFLTDVYKNGYADGKESVPGVELQDVEKALQDVKGIGPVVWNRIKERLAELFRKEQP